MPPRRRRRRRRRFCNILICMQQHIQLNKDERTQFFRKIYLSLYSKGLRKGICVRGELETEQRQQHIGPHSSGYSSISFPFFWVAQQGARGPRLCWELVLTLRTGTLTSFSDLQLINFSVAPGYIILLRPPASCGVTIRTQFNTSTVKVIP